jgi:hypothetical protein
MKPNYPFLHEMKREEEKVTVMRTYASSKTPLTETWEPKGNLNEENDVRELTEKHTNIEWRQTQANESAKTLYGW